MNVSLINLVFHHVHAFDRIDKLKQYTITILCIHAVCTVLWDPVVILVVLVGHCACVCVYEWCCHSAGGDCSLWQRSSWACLPANITAQSDFHIYSSFAHAQTLRRYEQSCLSCRTDISLALSPQDECSVSSEEFDMSDPTWISAERHTALSDLNHPSSADRMHSPQNTHKEEDGKSYCTLICVFNKGFEPSDYSRVSNEMHVCMSSA